MPALWYHTDGALLLCSFHSVMRLIQQGKADTVTIGITDQAEDVLDRIITQRPDVSNADSGIAVRACYPRRVKKMSPSDLKCDQCA